MWPPGEEWLLLFWDGPASPPDPGWFRAWLLCHCVALLKPPRWWWAPRLGPSGTPMNPEPPLPRDGPEGYWDDGPLGGYDELWPW